MIEWLKKEEKTLLEISKIDVSELNDDLLAFENKRLNKAKIPTNKEGKEISLDENINLTLMERNIYLLTKKTQLYEQQIKYKILSK